MPSDCQAPAPTRSFFDPFNSSSTGHQRAENRLSGSTSWRDSRSHKLAHQFGDESGRGGDSHLSDTVGAGSEQLGKDGRGENGSWEAGAAGIREKGWQDIRPLVQKRKRREVGDNDHHECKRKRDVAGDRVDVPDGDRTALAIPPQLTTQSISYSDHTRSHSPSKAVPSPARIFQSLSLYLNGSTFSSGISDHKLKSLFVQHGGSVSLSLGRRTVTHVVLGPGFTSLAAGKIQREVAKVGGKGVKYVTAGWVVDSVKAGKRLSESRYQAAHAAMKGQPSVLGKLVHTESRKESSPELLLDDSHDHLRREARCTTLTKWMNFATAFDPAEQHRYHIA